MTGITRILATITATATGHKTLVDVGFSGHRQSFRSRKRRLYPFWETTPVEQGTASNNLGIVWTSATTVYKPNPFHGLDRWLFAFDEWGHEHLSRLWHRPPMRWYCNWWDRRLLRGEHEGSGR